MAATSDAGEATRVCRIGIVTVSDRASSGAYEDRGGPAVEAELQRLIITPWEPLRRLVPDEWGAIESALVELADDAGCSLVVTTGGTGPAPRDITPDVTASVCGKLLPGFGELMREVSLREVPTAILSRQTAGVRGATLILNLPGKPASIATCLYAVMPAIPYCLDLIGGAWIDTDPALCRAFRPPR